jgi:hypothetical protein
MTVEDFLVSLSEIGTVIASYLESGVLLESNTTAI